MNNEQTKTPEEVLYQAITDIWPTTLRSWEYLQEDTRKIYRHAASAVISHVLQGAKWVLLEPGVMMLEGDETWSHFLWSWVPAARTRVCDADICRRPISLPSSVRPEGKWEDLAKGEEFTSSSGIVLQFDGKPEGPSTTPPASSVGAGADVPAAWKLPDPPAWMCWHRSDGWTQDMLPEGWRPLLMDEPCQKGDKVYVGGGFSDGIDTGFPMRRQHLHTITKRPLPSAEPVMEEKPIVLEEGLNELRDRCAQMEAFIYTLTSERDQLRKELESTKATFKVAEQEVIRLSTENVALKESEQTLITELNRWLNTTAWVQTSYQELGGVLGEHRADVLSRYITRLRSQFRWTPISERLPTEKDANHEGCVWMWDQDEETFPAHPIQEIHWSNVEPRRHGTILWMSPIPLPEPSPDTEEQAMRREYEDHVRTWGNPGRDLTLASDGAYAYGHVQSGWLIWKAAKQSTGEAA